ncbi:YhfT family protein [Entomospira culicis]|uniref:Uncharacterized protein n=1 Tax=Entomospira culicis TaxID=2719989 RepID=A0A968KUF5_9SPIO|nr:YhfT family protein [Entomospira culicis]NIZ19581.1 hypothetical protein [Entomospira culicis]NIZ69514.1 hypothetical protein [Entomospira culicis]WDI37966.1 YhfT family protein [Entomospira culicis]WDI39590.1 YhfT family protein [Entomospira culicis]
MAWTLLPLLGMLATWMANQNIAVFNDALRPIALEHKEGRTSKSSLALTSFAFSIGYVIGFIPPSLATGVIIVHVLLLGTDMLGTYLPNKGGWTHAVVLLAGGFYGLLVATGLEHLETLFAMLPYNFLGELALVSSVVLVAFALFPALVVALQYGWKRGLFTTIFVLLTQILVGKFGAITWQDRVVLLNANAMSLLVGMIFMLGFAMTDRRAKSTMQAQMLNLFSQRVQIIRKRWYLFALSGGLIAMSASLGMVAESALSAPLYQEGNFGSAWMTELARVLGFIPLVITTGIATGIYSPSGIKMVFVIGSLMAMRGNPWLALGLGALWMSLEVLLLTQFALFLDKFPALRETGDHVRTAVTKVLEFALLIGGMMAAMAIAPAWGAMLVAGLYLLNGTFKKRFIPMAIGPMGALLVGIVANILVVFGLA